MLLRRIGYLLSLLAAVLMAAYFETYLTGFLLILVLSLPVLAFLLSLPGMLGLRIRLQPQGSGTVRDGTAFWRLETGSRFHLSIARADVRLHFKNRMTGAESSQRLRLLGTPTGSFLTLPADTGHCGLLEARVTRLRVCDCLGLFTLYKRLPAPALLPVLPIPIEPETLPDVQGGPPVLNPRPGGGPGEDYEIRPYRPGDPVKMIHWKLTCKRDQTVLREVLEIQKAEPLLTFDHFGPPEALDRVLDRLNALSAALVEERRPHTVRWLEQGNGRLRSYQIEGRRALERCMAAILACPAPLQGVPTPRVETAGCLCYHIAAEEEP